MTNTEIRAIASARKEMERREKERGMTTRLPLLQDKSGITFTYRGVKYTR